MGGSSAKVIRIKAKYQDVQENTTRNGLDALPCFVGVQYRPNLSKTTTKTSGTRLTTRRTRLGIRFTKSVDIKPSIKTLRRRADLDSTKSNVHIFMLLWWAFFHFAFPSLPGVRQPNTELAAAPKSLRCHPSQHGGAYRQG